MTSHNSRFLGPGNDLKQEHNGVEIYGRVQVVCDVPGNFIVQCAECKLVFVVDNDQKEFRHSHMEGP